MIQKEYTITDASGVHAKSATVLVTEASKFKCNIKMIARGQLVDLKSIIGVMSLAVYTNEHMIIIFDGVDQEEAASKINQTIRDIKLAKEL